MTGGHSTRESKKPFLYARFNTLFSIFHTKIKHSGLRIISDTQKLTGLPTTDPVRFGADVLVNSLIKHFDTK